MSHLVSEKCLKSTSWLTLAGRWAGITDSTNLTKPETYHRDGRSDPQTLPAYPSLHIRRGRPCQALQPV